MRVLLRPSHKRLLALQTTGSTNTRSVYHPPDANQGGTTCTYCHWIHIDQRQRVDARTRPDRCFRNWYQDAARPTRDSSSQVCNDLPDRSISLPHRYSERGKTSLVFLQRCALNTVSSWRLSGVRFWASPPFCSKPEQKKS